MLSEHNDGHRTQPRLPARAERGGGGAGGDAEAEAEAEAASEAGGGEGRLALDVAGAAGAAGAGAGAGRTTRERRAENALAPARYAKNTLNGATKLPLALLVQ